MRRLALAGAAALLLAGCGGSDGSSDSSGSSSSESGSELSRQKASEVVDAAFTALEEAGAARAVGSVDEDGTVLELDLQLEGEDASGGITMDGLVVQLVYVAGTAYVQGPAEFWTDSGMPEQFIPQLADQWVLMPQEAAGGFATLNLPGLVDGLRASDGIRGKVTSDELDGQEVVVITQSDGSTFTVLDDDANPYPLLIDEKGDAPASLEFSDFGEPAEIVAPPNPVDLNTLGG